LAKADIVQKDHHHVGSPVRRGRRFRPLLFRLLVGLADDAMELRLGEGKNGPVDLVARDAAFMSVYSVQNKSGCLSSPMPRRVRTSAAIKKIPTIG
jgi:hypothetical protein